MANITYFRKRAIRIPIEIQTHGDMPNRNDSTNISFVWKAFLRKNNKSVGSPLITENTLIEIQRTSAQRAELPGYKSRPSGMTCTTECNTHEGRHGQDWKNFIPRALRKQEGP